MSGLETILIVALALTAAALIAAVMMQQGRGAEIGAAFGSGSANTIFGSAGIASPLARLTWGLAVVFFALSLTLAYLAKQRALTANELVPGDVPAAPTTRHSDVPVAPGSRTLPAGNTTAPAGQTDTGVPVAPKSPG